MIHHYTLDHIKFFQSWGIKCVGQGDYLVARFPQGHGQPGRSTKPTHYYFFRTDAERRQFIALRMKENPNQEFVTIGPEFGVVPMNGVEYRHT